jgi:hypothetical protein
MTKRFNPPPNWPVPPVGWAPSPGWAPDPAWGPAPEGWQLWVDEAPYGVSKEYGSEGASQYTANQPAPQPRKKRRARWIVIPVLVLALFAGCSIVMSGLGSSSGGEQLSSKNQDPVSQEQVDAAPELTERDLALLVKDPEANTGKTIVLFAKITQFDAATGDCVFRANVAHQKMENSWDYSENAVFAGEGGKAGCSALEGFVAEDEVRVTATSLGSISYETQIRGNTTVPAFRVEKIESLTP